MQQHEKTWFWFNADAYTCFSWLLEKKAQGFVKHVGFSFHDSAELLDEILTRHPEMEFVQLQINYLDWGSRWVRSRAANFTNYDILADKYGKAKDCIACGQCEEMCPQHLPIIDRCVFNDIVNELAPKLEACDGLVVGSPVYYASANATLVALLTRLFYSTPFDKTMKAGASVVVARRGGLSATFDELNKFFTISGMPVASSQYWNSVHGRLPGEAAQDAEGLQTMHTLARNMTFLMKSFALGKEKYGLPEKESRQVTNFIR